MRRPFSPRAGIQVMNNPRPALNVTSAFDAFLFAPIVDVPGVMRLSVLSALARLDVDPWEEAARLATLSTLDAERSLVSTLNRLPGQQQIPPETESLSARLVALLPHTRGVTTAQAASTSGSDEPAIYSWIVWLCFVIVMSFPSLHQQAPTTSIGDSASRATAIDPKQDSVAEVARHGESDGANLGKQVPPIPLTAALPYR